MFLRRLEPRIVLDASLAGGTLSIEGTLGDDVIFVRGEPESVIVEINGTPQSFPAASVKRVVADGLAGNDLVENATKRPSTLAGGPGRDTLVGGNGNDSLSAGGQEDEVVRPRSGSDTVGHPRDEFAPLIDYTGHSSGLYELSSDATSAAIRHPGGTTVLNAAPGFFSLNVRLTDGDDVVRLSAFGTEAIGGAFISVDLAGGSDRIQELSASSVGNVIVHAGPANDDLRHVSVVDANGFVTLNGGGGDDVIPLFENYDATGGAGVDTVEWHVTAFSDASPEVRLNLGFEQYVFESEAAVRIIDGDGSRRIDVRDVRPIDGRRVTVLAGGGDDTVIGTDASDILVGGAGRDVVDYSHRATPIDGRIEFADAEGQFEISRVLAGDERDELRGFEVLVGTQAADALFAGAAGGKSIRLEGAGGADTLRADDYGENSAERGSITLSGGGGNDSLVADSRRTHLAIEGGRGDDAMALTPPGIDPGMDPAAAVQVTGGAGRDTLDDVRDFVTTGELTVDGYARMPDVDVWLTPGYHLLAGSPRHDVIVVRSPDQVPMIVRGNDGNDIIDASGVGRTRATIRGGAGDDTILGTASFDQLFGDDGNDSIDGGRGNDAVSGGPGNDTLTGGRDGDFVSGDEGDDLLIGGPRADRLFGGDGNDRFRIAGGGIDTADGGAGEDTLESGDAEDVLVSVEVLPQ